MNSWTIILPGIALLFFICYKEITRSNRKRLSWRITASVIALICLICMGLPLSVKKATAKTEAILLTPGADVDKVQRLIKAKNKSIPIYQQGEFANDKLYDSLHVFGYGLNTDELESIGYSHLVFHSEAVQNGIVSIACNRTIQKGQPLVLQGTYINHSTHPVRISLNAFHTGVDSVTIPSQKTKMFQLNAIPKQNGKAVFSVLVINGKDTIEKEPVPVEVVSTSPVKVMILSSSPDFENRFLKDWLSQNGYSVVTKTTISTNKSDQSFFNSGNISVSHLTTALLDSFDVMISDQSALTALPEREKQTVYNEVEKNGMGLIIRGDTIQADKNRFAQALYRLNGKQPSRLLLGGIGNRNEILAAEDPLFIHAANNAQVLIKDSADNIVTAAITAGTGKIITTTLHNTYTWQLSGNSDTYYALWNLLLQKAAKQSLAISGIEHISAMPFVNRSMRFSVLSNADSLQPMQTNRTIPAFEQDQRNTGQWQSVHWPSAEGWQPAFSLGGKEYNWYVYGANDWKFISAENTLANTEKYAINQQAVFTGNDSEDSGADVPVPLFYFFIPFIICCGFLWIERKMF